MPVGSGETGATTRKFEGNCGVCSATNAFLPVFDWNGSSPARPPIPVPTVESLLIPIVLQSIWTRYKIGEPGCGVPTRNVAGMAQGITRPPSTLPDLGQPSSDTLKPQGACLILPLLTL